MSSLIGHSLAGGTIYTITNGTEIRKLKYQDLLWLGWIIFIALAPDLDYIIPYLHPSSNNGLRITHSIFSCQILPLFTLVYLKFKGKTNAVLWKSGLQVIVGGFSHLGLDLLVGVTALPLIWPLDDRVFKLPFGILPSAGKISLFNYYFYYNLIIELGVLVPITFCCYYLRKWKKLTWKGWLTITFLILISGRCMYWAYGLSR